jgi:uroporphyrinogen-III decarboxylase
MERQYYLDLAARGLKMPIGADLVLHERADADVVRLDGDRLGAVVETAARRYGTPLAFPLMDLTLEKADLLTFAGVPDDQIELFHYHQPPTPEQIAAFKQAADRPFVPKMEATLGGIRYIAQRTDLLPVGMLIGPFSLMTKLVSDPIAPVAMAAAGMTGDDDISILTVERCLELAIAAVLRSAQAQIKAGAKAIIVCEPAANIVYLSPRQLRSNPEMLDRFVLKPNRELCDLLEKNGIDLIFHDCGELLTEMVETFAKTFRPAIMSLGSSRKLWEDAAVVPKDIVLYGNLPSKMFYSDAVMPVEAVRQQSEDLSRRMAECGHPFILGSECDVLHVHDAAETIRRKVDVMLARD